MSIETYLHELADADAPLKGGRLSNLSDLDDDDLERLESVWPTLRVDRRRAVLEQLAALAEDNPELDFDAVFLTALSDADAAARVLAIGGLWESEDHEVGAQLVRLVREDPSDQVRAAAAMGLGRFVLLGEYGDLRPRDAATVVETLRAVVTDPRETDEVRGRALEAVGACSQPWVKGIIEDAYAGGSDRLTLSAVHAMGRSADAAWLPTLARELHSRDAEMRFEAVTAYGEIEEEASVPDLIPMMDDEDAEVQEAAIQALGRIGGGEAKAVLRRRLRDPIPRVREAVEAALDQAQFDDDPMGLRL
ncbi:MAG: HEAT repeat domain-containing protein [Dehalococcoidia bacterium]